MSKTAELFEKYDDEFLKWELVTDRLSERPDLHAFLLLDKLCPGTSDIVSAAKHDEIFLDVPIELLDSVITDDHAKTLIRCGIRMDDYDDGLALFV